MKIPEQQINETTKVQEMQRDYIINIPKKEGQGLLKMCHTGYTYINLFFSFSGTVSSKTSFLNP